MKILLKSPRRTTNHFVFFSNAVTMFKNIDKSVEVINAIP